MLLICSLPQPFNSISTLIRGTVLSNVGPCQGAGLMSRETRRRRWAWEAGRGLGDRLGGPARLPQLPSALGGRRAQRPRSDSSHPQPNLRLPPGGPLSGPRRPPTPRRPRPALLDCPGSGLFCATLLESSFPAH